jgi:hypothetical protein
MDTRVLLIGVACGLAAGCPKAESPAARARPNATPGPTQTPGDREEGRMGLVGLLSRATPHSRMLVGGVYWVWEAPLSPLTALPQ